MAKRKYATVPKQKEKEALINEMSQWIKMYTEMETLL